MKVAELIDENGFLQYAWQLNNNQPPAKVYPYLAKKRGAIEKTFDVSLTGKSTDYRGVPATEFIRKLANRTYPESASVRMKEMNKKTARGNGWLIRNITIERALFDVINDGESGSVNFEAIAEDFQKQVKAAMNLPADELAELESSYPKRPDKVIVQTTVFRRNPAVVVEVLRRARGVCEGCGDPAPFERRTDGSPYLEVHHQITLAEGGEDVVGNAVALCPNCHRKQHYG